MKKLLCRVQSCLRNSDGTMITVWSPHLGKRLTLVTQDSNAHRLLIGVEEIDLVWDSAPETWRCQIKADANEATEFAVTPLTKSGEVLDAFLHDTTT